MNDDELDRLLGQGAAAADPGDHPDDAQLLAWVRSGDGEAIEDHLAGCRECRALALQLRRAAARAPLGETGPRTLAADGGRPSREAARARRLRAGVGAAGALAAAAVLVILLRPTAPPRFDLEEASAPLALQRGPASSAPGAPRYAIDGTLVLRLRGDRPVEALGDDLVPRVMVADAAGLLREVRGGVRVDRGHVIELRQPIRALVGSSTQGPQSYWVVLAPPDSALEGRAVPAIRSEATDIWPRSFELMPSGGTP